MRKLAVFALAFSAAVFIAQYAVKWEYLWILGAAFAVIGIGGLFFRNMTRLFIMLAAFGASLGFFYDFAFELCFFAPAEELDGYVGTVEMSVKDFPVSADYGYNVPVSVRLPGKPDVSAVMYAYDETPPELTPGDVLTVEVRLGPAGNIYGEKTDVFTSQGVFLFAYKTGSMELTEDREFSLRYLPKYAAQGIKEKTEEIFPDDVQGFARALLTGDRTKLKENELLTKSLSTAGIYHIVAVSGMHVAFLVGFIRMFTRKRRLTAFICIPAVVFFVLMTGASPSVVRAGVMQIFLLAAPLFRREEDSVTSLSAALMLLLLMSPYSAKNAGLQLSFASIAGIYVFSGRIYGAILGWLGKKPAFKHKITSWALRFTASSLSATLGASAFSLPLAAAYFKTVPLAAPLTNLLTLWAVSIAFGAGLSACIIGFILAPAGPAAGIIAAWPFRYISFAAELIAKWRFASLYLSNEYVLYWFMYLYAALAVFLAFRGKFRRLIIPAGMAAVCLCVSLVLSSAARDESRLTITALDVGQGQSIAIMSENRRAVVDCGGSSGNAGDTAAEYIKSTGGNELDFLILTHFHSDHANGAEELLNRLEVGCLIIPEPEDDGASWLSEDIIDLARRKNTDIIYVTSDAQVKLGGALLNIYAPLGGSGTNEKGLTVLCSIDDFDALITGDMNMGTERVLLATHNLPDIELLVAGHHGSKYSTGEELLEAVSPETVIISVGYNNYGHPSPETLGRIYAAGAEVYSTDAGGNITVRVK